MKILNSRKKVMTALALSAIALTGCTKINTVEYNGSLYNIEDNSLLKDYDEDLTLEERLTYNNTGLSIFILPNQDNNQLSIEYKTYAKPNNDIYEYINNAINDMSGNDTLSIHLSKGNLDFSNVDVTKFKEVMFDVANIDFDYTPFYGNTYNFLAINISNKTNIDSIIKFIENIKTENAYISLDFEDNTKVEDCQSVIDVLAKINNVESINLSYSNINEINVSNLACHTLTLHNPTTNKKINYDFTINDKVERLYVESSFDEQYKGESYLESFKIKSNNDNLWTHYQIYRYADSNNFNIPADDESVIDVPANTELDISGLDISKISNDWFKKFSNLKSIYIRPYPAYSYSFIFDNNDMTIDEAIAEKEYIDAKNRVNKKLKEIGVSYTASSDGYISIRADFDTTFEKVPDELYTVLKREFADSSKDCLMINSLDNQFDFSKVNLSNITRMNIELTGPNFDFTPFYNHNLCYLNLTIGENANHERILEFLKNIPDQSMLMYINFRDVEELQNPKLQQQYIDILSTKENIKKLTLDTNIINNLDLKNIVTENLSLYIKSDKDEINYDIDINDQVQDLTILTSYDEEYNKKTYIGNIKVNSNNNALITNLYFNNYSFDTCFNVNIDNDITNIEVPNAAGLRIVGVNFNDIDYDAINSLDYLRYLYICEDGNEDYAFFYYYKENTFDEALEAFKNENKKPKGKSLIIN